MITALLLTLQAGTLSPEVRAVMDRARREAAERRAEERTAPPTAAPAAPSTGQGKALPLDPDTAARLQQCLDTAMADPADGVKRANEWAVAGGSFSALQCRGFAHARAEQWDLAMTAFDTGATEALKSGRNADAARLWAQAGNAALAGGQAASALSYLDSALATGMADTLARGEAFLDRARANVALGKAERARTDMDQALILAAADPLTWLLSATLARRMNDLARAAKDIAQAATLSPDDASVALEQGNIAVLSGDDAGARAAWTRAVKLGPGTPQADAAKASIAQLDGAPSPAVTPASAPSPASSTPAAPSSGR